MVQELKTTNQANNGKKSIDLSALGEAATASIVSEKKEKPKLLEPVEATIKDVEIVRTDDLSHNRDDETKVFFRGYVTYTTEFIDPTTKELFTSRDSLGGLRFYVRMDDTLSPMVDATGEPVIERLWIGSSSILGKLLELVQKHDSNVVTYADFLGYFKEGDKVKIESLFNTYQGKQTTKQVIVEIL